MSNHLKNHYGAAQGPLGFPTTDKQAFAIEALLKSLPKDPLYAYRKATIDKAPTELSAGERSDVSWISTEDPDRAGDVVVAKGMNDSQFRLNPIVTLAHCYWLPPVGKSLWRRYVKDGDVRGIKAKTQYPARPADWNKDQDWPADVAFTLIQADLMRGKSIGFLPTKIHIPGTEELQQPGWARVNLVIDEWILLEYACCYLPTQQNAVVESVGKSIPLSAAIRKALGLAEAIPETPPPPPAVIPFTTLDAISEAVLRPLKAIDPAALAEHLAQDAIDRARGRI
jgi:hypothetical protein